MCVIRANHGIASAYAFGALAVTMPLLSGCLSSEPALEPREALRQATATIERILEEDRDRDSFPPKSVQHHDGESNTVSFWYYSHRLIAPVFAKGPNSTQLEIPNPDVAVNAQFIGEWPLAVQKLTVALAAGDQPDVTMVKRGLVARLAEAGRILPLDSILPQAFIADLPPNVRDAHTYGGRLVSLPADGFCSVMVFNKSLVSDPPADWAQLVQAAAALKAARTGPARGASHPAKHVHPVGYMPFLECLWSAGGDVVREGKCGLSSDAAARSMDFLVSLGSNGLAAWDTLGNEARALEKFSRGEVAMTVTSSAAISALGNVPFEVGVAPVPGETGPVSCWSNDVLVVFARKSGAGTTAIASLLDALTASPSMIEQMRRMGSVPVRVSIRKKVELSSGLAEAAGVARGTPLITSWNPVEIELNRYVNRALRWGAEQSTR